jgi:hypothetical protein
VKQDGEFPKLLENGQELSRWYFHVDSTKTDAICRSTSVVQQVSEEADNIEADSRSVYCSEDVGVEDGRIKVDGQRVFGSEDVSDVHSIVFREFRWRLTGCRYRRRSRRCPLWNTESVLPWSLSVGKGAERSG